MEKISIIFFLNIDLNFDWIVNLLGWIEEKGFSIMCFLVNL